MKDKWHRKLPFVKVIEKGVLHRDQTSLVVEKKKRKEREEKKERKKEKKKEEGGPASTGLQHSNIERFDGSKSELVCSPRGRVLSYSGYSLSKGHSMTMRFSPKSGLVQERFDINC